MSSNRNKPEDNQATRVLCQQVGSVGRLEKATNKNDNYNENWLSHTINSGAAKIDNALLFGATESELSTFRKSYKEHLTHLEQEHGLSVGQQNGLFRFDLKTVE